MAEIIPFDTAVSRIDGLVVVTVKQVTDDRGTVRELFRRSAFVDAGVTELGEIRQINVTSSHQGVVRGMHAEDMTKLVTVVHGAALGVYVDLRTGTSTTGAVQTVELVPGVQVLVPRGVANGFQALADGTQYVYCFDHEWEPGMAGQACDPLDPALGVDWPIPVDVDDPAQISAKDRDAPKLAELVGRPNTGGSW